MAPGEGKTENDKSEDVKGEQLENKGVMVKYSLQDLNSYDPTVLDKMQEVRKTHIKVSTAWATLEEAVKSHNLGALIKKIKYTDEDNDDVYISDSQELEDAIFMEGICNFQLLFLNFEVVYTAQNIQEHNHCERIGRRKVYPSSTKCAATSPKSFWNIFSDGIKEIWKIANIIKVSYKDRNDIEIFIFNSEELEKAVFVENIFNFHVFFSNYKIVYTAQNIAQGKYCAKIGERIVYSSSMKCAATSHKPVWNIFSDGIKEIWKIAEIAKIQYTGRNKHTIFIFNSEELEKAVFVENICEFHIFFDLKIFYTVQNVNTANHDEPDQSIGIKECYLSSKSCSPWNTFSMTVKTLNSSYKIHVVKYTDKENNAKHTKHENELQELIYTHGVNTFHVMYWN